MMLDCLIVIGIKCAGEYRPLDFLMVAPVPVPEVYYTVSDKGRTLHKVFGFRSFYAALSVEVILEFVDVCTHGKILYSTVGGNKSQLLVTHVFEARHKIQLHLALIELPISTAANTKQLKSANLLCCYHLPSTRASLRILDFAILKDRSTLLRMDCFLK